MSVNVALAAPPGREARGRGVGVVAVAVAEAVDVAGAVVPVQALLVLRRDRGVELLGEAPEVGLDLDLVHVLGAVDLVLDGAARGPHVREGVAFGGVLGGVLV